MGTRKKQLKPANGQPSQGRAGNLGSSGSEQSAVEIQSPAAEKLPSHFHQRYQTALVGIAASAGGLEALIELFNATPPDTGMSFLVVQHLDPNRASQLTEILSRATAMRVVEATDGMRLEDNRVYVIPPGENMAVTDGHLALKPRAETLGQHMPADVLFRSLAKHRSQTSIAVILSGGGSDGSIGMEEVKAAGGITFAQDEATAKHDSMPRSAIALGCVDFVLAPAEIGRQFGFLKQHFYLRGELAADPPLNVQTEHEEPSHKSPTKRGSPKQTATDPGQTAKVADLPTKIGTAISTDISAELLPILRLLRTATGVDFTNYKRSTVRRRVERRMALHNLETYAQYVLLLTEDPGAIKQLYQDLLIVVTSFFRDRDAFAYLATHVFPKLMAERDDNQPLRVWVAGCATGEEVYSIAIALLEFLDSQPQRVPIKILATDINESALARARAGIYLDNIVIDVSQERLRRFFTPVNTNYQINQSVRDLCVFSRHDLTRDPPFAQLHLVLCRNLMIYLNAELQKQLMPLFHYALRPAGHLMLGSSETVGLFSELFSVVDKEHKIYARKPAGKRPAIANLGERRAVPQVAYPTELAVLPPAPLSPAQDVVREADRLLLSRYVPAAVICEETMGILQFRGRTGRYLEPASGAATLDLLRMIREELRFELRGAFERALKINQEVVLERLQIRSDDEPQSVDLRIIPLRGESRGLRCFLILFEDATQSLGDAPRLAILDAPPNADLNAQSTDRGGMSGGNMLSNTGRNSQSAAQRNELLIRRLEQDLEDAREQLQATNEAHDTAVEELKSAHEEILSANEELQSTNEELQNAKEEMQSVNEELHTVNDELNHRNGELDKVNSDLLNLQTGVNIPIVIVGRDLRIRRFTHVADQVLNLIASDIGRPIGHIRPKINVPDLEELIANVIRTLQPEEREVQDGDGRWYMLRIRPYVTTDNKIDGAAVVIVDIDALKRVADEARVARDYAEAIVETVSEPLVVLDEQMRIRRVNGAFYRMFKVTQAQIENRSIFEIAGGVFNNQSLCDTLATVLPDNLRFRNLELEVDVAGGDRRALVLNAHCIYWEGSRTQMILLAMEDITDRKREFEQSKLLTREQAARTVAETESRAKDEFLAMLAHELRNPLGAINASCQFVHSRSLSEPDVVEALSIAERQVSHMGRILDDLLDVSRITRRKIELRRTLIDASESILQAERSMRPLIESGRHELETILPTERVQLDVDPVRFEQILVNLLSNAVKYTPRGGKIRLTAEAVQNHLEIKISDNGVGISPEMLPKIFDLFAQADRSLDRSRGGLGIGLTLVRSLVQMHGGTIEAASPGSGQGSTFTLRFPLIKTSPLDATKRPTVGPAEPKVARPGKSILIVDDNHDVARSTRFWLNHVGFETRTAASAEEALQIASEFVPDVVLLDIGLPGQDGYYLARQLRMLPGLRQAMLVAMTGYGREEDRQRSREAGIDHHLVKPLDHAKFLELLEERGA